LVINKQVISILLIELSNKTNAYVGNSAVGFGEKERYTDFSGGIAKAL
jgi:hypothetical protein